MPKRNYIVFFPLFLESPFIIQTYMLRVNLIPFTDLFVLLLKVTPYMEYPYY